MFKFFANLFKSREEASPLKDRVEELEELTRIQSEMLRRLLDKWEQVKEFREVYVTDLRVVANAIGNTDKRLGQMETLFQHLDYQVGELEERFGAPDLDEDEDILTTFRSSDDESNLN